MCGIVGGFGLSAHWISIAQYVQRRRGPDGSGVWEDSNKKVILGHERLSIIDITQLGHQPMLSMDGRIVMVFNGEIYNYLELRSELEDLGDSFKGNSDSEVLLALFTRYGKDCFSRLNGIFSAAFWDRSANLLTLVRDPMGVKPLYFCQLPDGLLFASELKTLIRSGMVKVELNSRAVLAHLGFLWSPGAGTIVKGISKVLPGHVIQILGGQIISDHSYRDVIFSPRENKHKSADCWALELAEEVNKAVERQMVSDVPLGAFLSGGLDSSAIVAFAQRHLQERGVDKGGKLQCFTMAIKKSSIGGEGFDADLPYAQAVAKHVGVDLQVVQVGDSLIERLAEMIYFLDEPTPDPAALNTLLIAELAKANGIKVMLSGSGGDDIFTGYRRHYALTQEKWWRGLPESLRHGLAFSTGVLPKNTAFGRRLSKAFQYADQDQSHRLAGYFLWLQPKDALRLLTKEFKAGLNEESLFEPIIQTLNQLPADTDPLNQMLYLECKHFLADHNLNYCDKMGMASGIEIRVPLLDLDLVDFAGTIPASLKQRGRIGKWILKKAMEPYLPGNVIYRPKTGFGQPLRSLLHGILKPLVDEVLSKDSLLGRGVFEPAAVADLIAADRAGQVDGSYSIFGIVCLELWCRQYLDGNYAIDPSVQFLH